MRGTTPRGQAIVILRQGCACARRLRRSSSPRRRDARRLRGRRPHEARAPAGSATRCEGRSGCGTGEASRDPPCARIVVSADEDRPGARRISALARMGIAAVRRDARAARTAAQSGKVRQAVSHAVQAMLSCRISGAASPQPRGDADTSDRFDVPAKRLEADLAAETETGAGGTGCRCRR